jgi:hypothetical protein
MKKLLVVAVLFATVSQLAYGSNLGPNGKQRLIGPGGTQHLIGPGGTHWVLGPNGTQRQVLPGGGLGPVMLQPSRTGVNGGGVQSLASRQAMKKRVCHKLNKAYYAKPGSVGVCIARGSYGASRKPVNKGQFVGGVY